ncbi:MAG: hypothetical protein JSV77_09005 [Dehalococcoidales bacterium]|nr:MAG: hypothetical protein JSV77_09005 [Dehalococcoidales bacterium]
MATLVPGIAGILVLLLIGFILSSLVDSISYDTIRVISLGTTAAVYFLVGFTAGFWANWKGASYGASAAIVTWLINLIIFAVVFFRHFAIFGRNNIMGDIYYESLPYVFIVGVVGIIIGTLGGFLGGRIRN